MTTKSDIHKHERLHESALADLLKSKLSPHLKYATDLSQEKGASYWFTVLSVEEFGFALHKDAFRDPLPL